MIMKSVNDFQDKNITCSQTKSFNSKKHIII